MSNTPSDALAELRHLYANMIQGGVRDAASAKRIAEGLLAPAIELLERSEAPQPVVREPLTEEQVAEACGWKAGMGCKPLPTELRIARAIEAAHGITQKGGKDDE
jgi:hypothetical protein